MLFLNRRFETGGAERQLISLLKGLDKTRFRILAVSLYDGGELSGELENIDGLKWVSLGKRGRWHLVGVLSRARRFAADFKPHVIYGYMGPTHFIALVLARLTGAKTVWAVRASNVKWEKYGLLSRYSFWLECRLSRFADLNIANSFAGKEHVVSQGFPVAKTVVIPNGIDADVFRPDAEAKARLRAEWGVAKHEHLIGLVARLDPMKDHPTFLRAASLLAKERNDVRFVCVGDGPKRYKSELVALARSLDLDRRLNWAGPRSDMLAVYNALDIATSASHYGEGSSNAIGEAMACGTPCVVTNVGDSAKIVGATGEVVKPRDAAELADGWRRLLDRLENNDYSNTSSRIETLRGRIQTSFSKRKMIQDNEAAFCSLASGKSIG